MGADALAVWDGMGRLCRVPHWLPEPPARLTVELLMRCFFAYMFLSFCVVIYLMSRVHVSRPRARRTRRALPRGRPQRPAMRVY
jgi:hypothetical protein